MYTLNSCVHARSFKGGRARAHLIREYRFEFTPSMSLLGHAPYYYRAPAARATTDSLHYNPHASVFFFHSLACARVQLQYSIDFRSLFLLSHTRTFSLLRYFRAIPLFSPPPPHLLQGLILLVTIAILKGHSVARYVCSLT